MKRGLFALREKVGKRNGTIPVRETTPREPRDKAKGTRPHIPRALYRIVFKRDGGCCSYVMKNGQRCNSRRHCELDHIVPVARGGKTEAENLRLVCRMHNQRLADEAFGEEFMKKFR